MGKVSDPMRVLLEMAKLLAKLIAPEVQPVVSSKPDAVDIKNLAITMVLTVSV
jgi:hypothetical protein